MTHTQPITIASLLQVAQVANSGQTAQSAGEGPLDDVDLAGLVRSGRVQFVDAQGQPIPPGQEEAIARGVLSAIADKTGKAVTDADVAQLTQALQAATAGKGSTPVAVPPSVKGKAKGDGTANQEFLAALVSQMVQAQGAAAPADKTHLVAHAGVIRVCLTNLSASATTTAAGQKATAGQNIPSLASAVQTMLTPVGTIDPATGSVALTGANPAGQDAAATVAKVAAQAQAIQAQSQANASAPDLAAQTGSTSNNAILTPDALAAALVQAEQTAATKVATVVAGKMAAAAKVASPDGKVSSGSAALPANPLGIVLPPAGSVSRTVAAKAPAATAIAAATSTDSATAKGAKPVEKIAAKSGNARLAAAVAGNSLNHDVALASAQAAQGSASGASVVQTAQAGTAADTLAGANLAMPAALADQIAGQLPLDGTMPGLITIHLNPPELGRLQLTFENDASGGVVAVIRAENPDTLAQLRQEMPSVMEKINETGVNLKRVEVTLSGQQGNATDSAGREGMWQQARQEQPLRWGAYEEDAPAPDTAAVATRNAGWTNGTGLNVWM